MDVHAATGNGRRRSRLAFFLPSLDGGGAERVMLNLAVGFAERGFQTDIVLASATGSLLAHVPSTVSVVDLKASGVLKSLLPLTSYLRRQRPVALVSALDHANVVAMAAARASGGNTRSIISIHSTTSKTVEESRELRTRAIPWLLGRLHRWADAIVAVSEGVAEDAGRARRIPRNRIDVIYNPVITPSLLRSASEPAAHPWFDDTTRRVILGVGRLSSEKNFLALVDAFALVRRQLDVRLVILGEGPERAAIEARVRQCGLQADVALPGFVHNPYACMKRSAVVVLSSEGEGLPTVLIESLAVGTPVVATDCPGGTREILLSGKLGSLVPVGDVSGLAFAIEQALAAPRLPPPWDALNRFTPDTALAQYQRLVESHA